MLLDWYNILDCDCQHGIYYRIYHSRLGVADMYSRYVSFLLSSFILISADLISVCISLQECGSRRV